MDPNQQPNPTSVPPVPPQPQPTPQQPGYGAAPPQLAQPAPTPYDAQSFGSSAAQSPMQPPTPGPAAPAPPSAYSATPQPDYDPNYLDSIAAPPPRAAFFSGGFGKIFFAMIGVFVLAVSIMIAFSGKDKTEDLQQTTVRITNFVQLAKKEKPYLKSNKLSATNTSFTLLLVNGQADGEKLLGQAGVKKTQYSKKMVATETKLNKDLTQKFEDARLNAQLDSTYARSMAAETQKLISLLNIMAKKSGAKAIRDYAKSLATNLTSLQKSFDSYTDDGN